MTKAPRREPRIFRDLDEAAAAVRAGGLRLSAPRRAVLGALFAAAVPVSAEQIAAGLGGRVPTSEISSVYRNLERLEELGIVRHLHVGHGPGLYALETGSEQEYLACEHCGRVTMVDAERLAGVHARIRDEFGFEADFSHFPLVGLCGDCAAQAG
jgi:Fur family ferric uptake transcriptional regulator